MSTSLLRLASLDLIRGFVAVGRRMSVTLAAADLCLTQSAVSRQIHALEAALGVQLFHRGYRAITFTAAGEQLFRTADSVVRQLQDTIDVLKRPGAHEPVTITASIGVAALWLLPRLPALQRRHPELDVRVAANDKPLDLRAEGIDLGIRYASVDGAPAGATRLFDESIVPVAHPSLGLAALDAATLPHQVLLEFDGPRRPLLSWSDHLHALGLDDVKPRSMLRFNQYDQVVQAALAGQGVALGRAALVEPLIAQGRLMALGDGTWRASGYAYWLCRAEGNAPRREVRDVEAWIIEEAREVEAAPRHTEPAPARPAAFAAVP